MNARTFLGRTLALGSVSLLLSLSAACGGKKEAKAPEKIVQGQRPDDQTRCAYVGRSDREISETSSPASKEMNIRRVYGYSGLGEERARTLICREVDTNFDGIKDVVRTYDDRGEKLLEQADADYDGRIDTWVTFSGSYASKVEIDTNGDGIADQLRSYVGGLLVRIQRDLNFDGDPDQFEVYREGRLDRIGVDDDFDGQVDRWDRDDELVRAEVAESQKRTAASADEQQSSGSSEAE